MPKSNPRDRGMLPALGAAALSRPQAAQSEEQNAGGSMAGVQDARHCLLPGRSPALARMLRDDIAATYGTALPSALTCLQDDFEACVTHLRFPLAHRQAIRTTNLLERLFGEEWRRTKVPTHSASVPCSS
jgi:hypothetical protein